MNTDNLLNKIKVLKNNSVYRFSDVFNCYGIRWQLDRDTILSDPKYEKTILRDYLLNKRHEKDYETLRSAIGRAIAHGNFRTPTQRELVLHLRLGDIMDDYKDESGKRHYKDSKVVYENIFATISKKIPFSVERVSIVTAMHFGSNQLNNRYFYSESAYQRSLEVAHIVISQMANISPNIDVVSNTDFDMDLCFMATAPCFVKGLTNASSVIEKCLPTSSTCIQISRFF